MKVFTYYQKLDFRHQEELLALWVESWAARGFKPVVLNEENAKKSDFYGEFVANINRLHQEIADKPHGLRVVADMFGLDADAATSFNNTSRPKNKHYREYYVKDQTISMVSEIAQDCIEDFGYTF